MTTADRGLRSGLSRPRPARRRPLVDPGLGPPLDQSIDGRWKFGDGARRWSTRTGPRSTIELPDDWPGPTGEVRLSRPLPGGPPGRRAVRGLPGTTTWAGWGPATPPRWGRAGQRARAGGRPDQPRRGAIGWRVPGSRTGRSACRTSRPTGRLLVTSGEFGDKLPIGFRGCHAALEPVARRAASAPCDLRVVASLPNRLAGRGAARAGRGRPVLRAGDAEHARPRLPAVALRRGRSTSSAATGTSGRAWTTAKRWPGRSRSWS